MSEDLAAFLHARLNEDAEMARAAALPGQQTWEADLSGKDPIGLPSWPAVVRYVTGGRLRGAVAHLPITEERSEGRMAHMARHDPARVLAEVAAKRAIVAEHAPDHLGDCRVCADEETFDEDSEGNGSWSRSAQPAPCRTLRLLAAPYAGADGFRPEWAPDA